MNPFMTANKMTGKQDLALSAVVTTVQAPTLYLKRLAAKVSELGGTTYVIGDLKTPDDFSLNNARFFSLKRQQAMSFRLSKLLPINRYARKNIGYLTAFVSGSEIIYETDDEC